RGASTLTPFSIQAILNKKEERGGLAAPEGRPFPGGTAVAVAAAPAVCCWRLFGETDASALGGAEDSLLASPAGTRTASARTAESPGGWDSDSALSEENEGRRRCADAPGASGACRSGGALGLGQPVCELPASKDLEEEVAGRSDSEMSASVSGDHSPRAEDDGVGPGGTRLPVLCSGAGGGGGGGAGGGPDGCVEEEEEPAVPKPRKKRSRAAFSHAPVFARRSLPTGGAFFSLEQRRRVGEGPRLQLTCLEGPGHYLLPQPCWIWVMAAGDHMARIPRFRASRELRALGHTSSWRTGNRLEIAGAHFLSLFLLLVRGHLPLLERRCCPRRKGLNPRGSRSRYFGNFADVTNESH
ncbi:homeobox protein Nkx-3.2, partial [Tupaia chinensis]|uniref:homeobox protein Nkx-3.2 n=1 Tax=Tupaia chinensis TaxID=246437 RepID=UPI0003C8C95D